MLEIRILLLVGFSLLLINVLLGCREQIQISTSRTEQTTTTTTTKPAKTAPTKPKQAADPFAKARAQMVQEQLAARDIRDQRVLQAMAKVPRHHFMPESSHRAAYGDHPMPIGHNQTISQPYIVAYMAQVARIPARDAKVLEVGTGMGYAAAVYAEIAKEVYTIEIVPQLGNKAAKLLKKLGYTNVQVRIGDGYVGWPEQAPFDAIIVAAAPPYIPEPLKQQLKVGGRLVIPVGRWRQYLRIIERTATGFREDDPLPVRFVPMTGKAQQK
jgi:protein-L-isoaspartate(D-aspartate) O-methyltransferase